MMLLRIVVGVYVGSVALIFAFQAWLVYHPTRSIIQTPDRLGLAYEAVTLSTSDGVRLAAWYVPAAEARGTVLFCHGNEGNISHWLGPVETLHELGLNVLAFDYRGYGQSEGRPTEAGTHLDTESAWRYLVENRRVPAGELIILGRSLGGAVAAALAEKHPPAALILESTFTSLPDEGQDLLPFVPMRLLVRFDYNTLVRMHRIRCPVLVVHSRQDSLIAFKHAERLFDAAAEPKTLLELSGGHDSAYVTSAELHRKGLEDFLTRVRKLRSATARSEE
jgi:fermentation-respiration switch protein FrsA (DUF1100 family)